MGILEPHTIFSETPKPKEISKLSTIRRRMTKRGTFIAGKKEKQMYKYENFTFASNLSLKVHTSPAKKNSSYFHNALYYVHAY